ncbi:PREDICTED: uncharacterized protein LOC109585247 [Amphimedon queenslandica]|uniref:Uncharacterized protein n=1 Tax=Amphimedon queenslandica TaxID=400682 RepID=A0AAN0JJ74_AMPQE|nr:PREDICTED: uncharacterized protein LOC109585247 [Amphimedon queenslandica]|eukprot:XP_019856802.1 PREDICTED: uncharacterized protein LOC109585247 [Amphimedon queenslandica]
MPTELFLIYIVITLPPVSITVPPFTTATFTCEGTGDILNWIVGSAELTDSIKQQREISVNTTTVNNTNFSSVLTVNALPINDRLGVGCETITFNPFNRVISNSELTIRGISPVKDVRHNFTSYNLLLVTWSPPVYYSKGVDTGSTLSYQVLVIDEDGDAIVNTTTPDTYIEVVNVTECDTFNTSVIAILDQYTSSHTVSNNGNYSITEYDTQLLLPSISFELGCSPSRCLVSLMDGNTEVTDIIDETDHMIGFKLSPFRHYELTAVVKNLRGKTKATYNTSISTFHAQNISIISSYANGSVSVQCVFVSGSTADGCHVIFTDTSNGTVFNVSLPLAQQPTLVTLPAGNYTVTAYDIINGSLYGPAVYPTPVEIIKIMHSTSSSTHESISSTASSEVIPIPTSSTTISTLGTETTSSASETNNDTNNVVPIVAGTVSSIVLVMLIILAVCASITGYKRKRMNGVLMRFDIVAIQQPQAETNPYQAIHELINEVPNNISQVIVTSNRPIDEENPYHVTMSEFLPDNHHTIPSHAMGLMTQEPRPSLTSMTTQETTLEDSILSTTSNNIHDSAYTTVNFSNGIVSMTATKTATVAPTYAVIAKRTDTTVPPAVDQHVEYDTVTGHIDKRGGGVTVYPPDDISAIPPPPSYAATIAQEHGTTVSNSQFIIVPVQVTDDAAVVHGQYEKYPPTYTGDEYGSKTPVQDQTNSTDGEVVPSKAPLATLDSNFANDRKEGPTIDEPPMNGEEILPIQFRENVF